MIMKEVFKHIKKNKYIILIIVLYILLFLQLKNIFIYDDDFMVKFPVHLNYNFNNIINWIVNRMNYFYYEWSGRLVTHFITTAGLSFTGIKFYVILHPVVVFFMSLTVAKIIKLLNNKTDIKKSLFFISLLSISTTIIIARENTYWISAGVPYVWGFALTIYIFYFLFKRYQKEIVLDYKKITFLSILILINSFMLEQNESILLGYLFVFFIGSLKKKNKKLLYNYVILGLVAIAGLLLTYFVPGNSAKVLIPSEVPDYTIPFIKFYLNKATSVLSYIVDKDLMLVYLSFISLICFFDFTKKKNKNKLDIIENWFVFVFTILLLVNSCFNFVPIFNSTDRFDSWLYQMDYPGYNDLLALMYTSLIIIYFVIYSHVLYKQLKKYNVIIWCLWLISFISIIFPDFIIRYNGSRYSWPFFIITLLVITLLLQTKDKRTINFALMIISLFVVAYLFSNITIIAILLILFLLMLLIKDDSIIYNILITMIVISFFLNHLYTMYMYYDNKKIIDYNERMILNSKDSDDIIVLTEIPYEKEKYGWHIFYSDYNGYHNHYDYLYEFLPQYYNIDPYKISILERKDNSYNE